MSRLKAVLVAVVLAGATHLDWHVARPTVHHLSLGLRWHWMFAIPVFALAAWYVDRVWPARRAAMSIAIVGSGLLLGGVVEPAWEFWVEQASFDWAFGRLRTTAALLYGVTGVSAYAATLIVLRSRRDRTGLRAG